MPTNNLSPKSKNYLSSIPPNMAERFGSAVSPYLQGVQELFPPTNPYGQALSNFLLGQAPQAAQRMAAGYPNVLFNTSNLLGGKRIVNPVALDMLGALPVATALKGAGLAKGGVAATFAGARAKTANREALAVAERMKAAGVADEEIHKATGWFFGSADGKPRFEIPDDAARLNAGALRDFHNDTSLVRQSRLMQHPELSAAYPDTGNIPYRKHNNPGASYDPAEDAINIPQGSGHPDMSQEFRDTAVKSTTLHELQHAIQQREGFARGGSPEYSANKPIHWPNDMPDMWDVMVAADKIKRLSAQFGAAPEEMALKYRAAFKLDDDLLNRAVQRSKSPAFEEQFNKAKVWGEMGPHEAYRRLAGEAEARLTQSRMDMTGAERAASYPPGMYDVPVGDQIVRYGEGPALATTWHGSPHKFEPTELNDLGEFNAAKIGTGEGAQAYGYGHYTAENPSIAKSYQEELSRPQATLDFVDRQGNPANMEHFNDHPELASEIDNAMEAFDADGTVSPDFDEVLNNVRFNLNSEINNRFTDPDDLPALKNSLAKLDAVEGKYNFVRNENAGALYKVDIPDEHIARMLDWDKPLNQQSWYRPVADVVKEYKGAGKDVDAYARLISKANARGGEVTGGQLYEGMLSHFGGSQAKVSEFMREAGIPGVRYLDAGSRGAEGGTSNFVVFPGNEHMMTILERNGQAMSVPSMTEGEMRHQTAQRNAALPVEQGGLGLAAGNTAVERAAAQGGKDSYHFTNEVFDNFDPLKIGSATDEGWLGHGFYSTTDKSVNAPSANGLSGWGKRVSMPLTILDEQLNKQAPYKNWKSGKQEAMREATGYPENLTAKEISNALSLEGKTGLTLDYSPAGYNHQEIMTINPENIRSRFAAFDPFRRNAAIAAAMGVAAPDLLAGESQSPESQAIARYREIKGPKSVVRMEAALRTAGVPLPKSEPVAYIQGLVDRAHRRN